MFDPASAPTIDASVPTIAAADEDDEDDEADGAEGQGEAARATTPHLPTSAALGSDA